MTMPETTRWFLLYGNAQELGARPGGLAREVRDVDGTLLRHETIRRDLTWGQTDLFLRRARADWDADLVEVDQEGAEQFIRDLRARLCAGGT